MSFPMTATVFGLGGMVCSAVAAFRNERYWRLSAVFWAISSSLWAFSR